MKTIFKTFSIFFIAIALYGQQLSGVYVLSEGGFSPATSMLSKLNLTNNEFTQNIFSPGNIGLYPDGLIVTEENIFLVEQGNFGGAGKIYKLDKNGTIIHSQEVGTNPYSLAIANGKIYISNGPVSNVSVINQNDLSTVKEISVGVYPQEIISHNGRVFVANNSLWGGASDSTVSVIDSETDEVIETIKVKLNPSSLAISNDGDLLIGCPSGIIYKVELTAFTRVDSFEISNYGFGKDIFVDKNNDMVYFFSSTNQIEGLNLSTKEVIKAVSDSSIIYTYGYAYDYISGNHYLTDAKNFASNGSLMVYNSEGELINNYETGIAPRRIVLDYNNTVSVNDEIIELEFSLAQNYPNPFNPTTTIGYTIPNVASGFSPSNVIMVVYDALGREVGTLVNEQKSPGVYEVNFDGSNLTSGIYYYKLHAGNYISIRKMMLIK